MNKLLFANVDYRTHMTNEGNQLQEGLRSAGWILTGPGYDGIRDAREAVERYQPHLILVHDPRDWDPASSICFLKEPAFTGMEYLRSLRSIPKAVVVKDAATLVDYQDHWARKIGADIAVIYYHPQSVQRFAPWLERMHLVRTFHTLDPDDAPKGVRWENRAGVLISGAVGRASYPLRARLVGRAKEFGWDRHTHPGYSNKGSRVAEYLQVLSMYKVHVTTASRYGFLLRKIIESLACGCVPVTDLPDYDPPLLFDHGIVRIDPNAASESIAEVCQNEAERWDPQLRETLAARAWAIFDYRVETSRLSHRLEWTANCWRYDPARDPDGEDPGRFVRRPRPRIRPANYKQGTVIR